MRVHGSIVLAALVLAGCVHAREDVHVLAVEPPPAVPPADRVVIAVDDQAPRREPAAPAGRPRLSQTVTLGEGTPSQYTPGPVRESAPQGTSPNVVVNNTVVVHEGPRVYGGYGGYGGYRSSGGWGRPGVVAGEVHGAGDRPAWGATGWEGARRTAAPGQTPGVGGNWAPPPSHGPAQMK